MLGFRLWTREEESGKGDGEGYGRVKGLGECCQRRGEEAEAETALGTSEKLKMRGGVDMRKSRFESSGRLELTRF